MTPGIACSVSIYNGLAYVADGDAGMQVINYLPYDSKGQPPTITLSASFSLNSPTNGVVEEGKLVRVTANVTDDVQVRNVEFYFDGVKAAMDGNFPFEHRFITPTRSLNKTNFTLRARAIDTGGSATWSNEYQVSLTADTTRPRVTRVIPSADANDDSVNTIAAYFSEPLNVSTLNATTFALLFAGPDRVVGTADDLPVTNGTISYRDALNAAFLTFSQTLPAGEYRATVTQGVTDTAGNALAADFAWSFGIPTCVEPLAALVSLRPGEDDANDVFGNNNGTPQNGATFATGKVKQAFSFDGVDDYVRIDTTNALQGSFTVEMWVMPNHPTAILGLIGSRSPVDYSFDLKLLNGSAVYCDIGNGSSWIVIGASGDFKYSVGSWCHIACAVTFTNFNIFANGALIRSGNYNPSAPLLFDVNHQLKIGRIDAAAYSGYPGEWMNGRIDEPAIYRQALNADEIKAIYEAGGAGKCRIIPLRVR